jgi:hypothetical protein
MMTRVNTNVICRRVLCATIVSCLVLLCGLVDVSRGQQRPTRGTVNRLAQQGNTDAAATLFRSGRDLITDQEWAKAQGQI